MSYCLYSSLSVVIRNALDATGRNLFFVSFFIFSRHVMTNEPRVLLYATRRPDVFTHACAAAKVRCGFSVRPVCPLWLLCLCSPCGLRKGRIYLVSSSFVVCTERAVRLHGGLEENGCMIESCDIISHRCAPSRASSNVRSVLLCCSWAVQFEVPALAGET